MDSLVLILFISFLIILMMGFPVAYALGISSFIYLIGAGIDLFAIPQKMYGGMDSFVLLCIPGFVLAGNLMNVGGITQKIVDFGDHLFGHIRGGLGFANIGSSMIFAGISGTAIADTASVGGIMIPAMKKSGYDAEYASAITAASSTIGPIIPPSVPMIIAGTLTGISVGRLFIAGIIPGVLVGLFQFFVNYYISKKRNYPKGEKKPIIEILKSFRSAFWAVLMTMIILFGILGGIFTPTEAAIVAILYAFIVGIFVYKELNVKMIPNLIVESARSSASILMLVGFANVFAWILASEQIPQMVANGMLSLTTNKIMIIILINLLLLFVGMFMETISAIVILFPVLLVVTRTIGMPDIQFAVMAVLNLVIGLVTPPVGVCLFVASKIGGISLAKISKAIMPFLIANLLVLLLVSFVEPVTMWLPSFM
ncbi:tripartite ATP-independent transporter DctM subunit [Acetoanaerobium pronyense]|uniref:Tripartite ATP-independent transporter DctM subunit n=1 Tax=Acetoanaerobium pronyense TaxID=1482736 RepID=A0ABS4KLB8_9FIRM|nr:TRAP transporter large permease [Acetoanaerobium pronyense]MBP2028140.1 tripartite ATP-independent transporter DctM subunit [Acetoanaerobium pronyense]